MIDALSLAQALIRCPSVTPEDCGAQDVLIEALKPLGFDVYDVTSGVVRNTFFRLGCGTPHLCFFGHTDVVPAGVPESWTHPPFEGRIQDGRLCGRGASDMKGGIACFVSAVSRFLERRPFSGSLSFLITGDEEGAATDGTVKALAWMQENGHIPDDAIVGEPTNPENLGDEIKIGRRGSLNGELIVRGMQGHVAYPRLADNPLPRLVRLLDALAGYEFDKGSPFFPATNLELTTIDAGNTADNVIPGKVTARFNVRFNDLWNATRLESEIRRILDRVGGSYELQVSSNAESFLTEQGRLSGIVSAAVETVTGCRPELSTKGGTSDARFVRRYCRVIEYGLVNKTIHQANEYAETSDIEKLSEIYGLILERYFTEI